MKVTKWGNSLAVRLPVAVVKALNLKEGDEIYIKVAGQRHWTSNSIEVGCAHLGI
jgi:antitoxin MazE